MTYKTPPKLLFSGERGFDELVTPTYKSGSQSGGSSNNSPINSTFSIGHTRMSSSISSTYSSSPPAADQLEQPLSMTKRSASVLPDVAEETIENDVRAHPGMGRYSFDLDNSWNAPSLRSSYDAPARNQRNYRDDLFSNNMLPSAHQAKRRKSGDSTFNRLTNRMLQRIPTLRNLKVTTTQSAPCSGVTSQVTSPVMNRSRSNSRSRPLFRSGSDLSEKGGDAKMSTSIETIEEDDVEMPQEASLVEQAEIVAPEAIHRTSTPLLPLIMDEAMANPPIETSILQPPNVAPSSAVPTPYSTPQIGAYDSPALSSKASWAHFGHFQKDSLSPNWEMPSMFLSEVDDEFNLGHADFTILPQPFLPNPENCDQQACRVLLSAWETARSEYSKHLMRTSTHYGNMSRVYASTEKKWESIDATWRDYYQRAQNKASENGEAAAPDSPKEPAKVVKIPSVDDKFPQIADAGIVGAMEQVPPQSQIQRQASMKAQIFKMFGLRGRSSSAL